MEKIDGPKMQFKLSMCSACAAYFSVQIVVIFLISNFSNFCLFVDCKDQDVLARCTLNQRWYSARIVDIDIQNDVYFVHFYGWDDACNEWVSADDIEIDDFADSGEWTEDWADPPGEEMFDDDDYYSNDAILGTRMFDIFRTVQQTANHITEIYLILIMIVLMFVVMVMYLISVMQ